MTDSIFDPTQPGPAGLWFDTSNLTEEGHRQERKAGAALERPRAFCGTLNAPYGYGDTLRRPGVMTCSDADCRAQGEAWASERDRAERESRVAVPVVPAASVEAGDLFGPAPALPERYRRRAA